MKEAHLLCSKDDIARSVLLPGDHERVLRVAEYLDDAKEIAFNREFRTVTGSYKGVPITVTSTGIGGCSMGIALEELINCGAENFIRIGSCGALQPDLKLGDLVIASAAVREDGLSKTYVDQVYPAVSDFEITSLLKVKSEEFDFAYKLGICRSHESFYIDHNQEVIDYWSSKNVLASDMETASLFTLANLRGVRAASVLNVVVNDAQDSSAGINSYVNQEEVVMEGERREIKIALEALAEYNS
jgi:uridine phosphorylase